MVRTHMVGLLLAIALFGGSAASARSDAKAAFYVDPNHGSDTADGTTAETAFRSISRAQRAVRDAVAKGRRNVVVTLRGGRHNLDRTLVFTNADGGGGSGSVVYRASAGERPVLSGGLDVTGRWSDPDRDGTFEVAVPAGTRSRNFYVAGQPAMLARSRSPLPGVVVDGTGLSTSDIAIASYRNPRQVEFVWRSDWKWKVFSADRIERTGAVAKVRMKQPGWSLRNGGRFDIAPGDVPSAAPAPDFIQNARELLDQPGEWYLDEAASRLFYRPSAGVDLTRARTVLAIVPDELIRIEGDADTPVTNLRFEGLTFSHATYLAPQLDIGHAGQQSNGTKRDAATGKVAPAPTSVTVRYARGVAFTDCTFRESGAGGLFFDVGAQVSSVTGSTFTALGSSGIQVGRFARPSQPDDGCIDCESIPAAQAVRAIRIENNHVHAIGAEMVTAAQGIHVAWARDVVVAHNEVHDLGYTGIATGYRWSDLPGDYGNNQVIANRVYDVMKEGRDGGGIYNLGYQGRGGDGLVAGNHVFLMHDEFGALYPDEGSSAMRWEGNVAENLGGHRWLHDNSFGKGTQQRGLVIHGNYTDTHEARLTGSTRPVATTYFVSGDRPAAADAIAASAGLQPAWRRLASDRPIYEAEQATGAARMETALRGFNGSGYVPLTVEGLRFPIDGGLGGAARMVVRYATPSGIAGTLVVGGSRISLPPLRGWGEFTVPIEVKRGRQWLFATGEGAMIDEIAIEGLIRAGSPEDLVPTAGSLTRPSTLADATGWTDAAKAFDGRSHSLAVAQGTEAAIAFALPRGHDHFTFVLRPASDPTLRPAAWKVQVGQGADWQDVMDWRDIGAAPAEIFQPRDSLRATRFRLMVRAARGRTQIGVAEFRVTGQAAGGNTP